jgi:hypothetical protein
MILTKSNRLAITIALVLLLSQAFGFARINFDAVELTLYVNNQHPDACDWNSGKTKDKPLLTLQHAFERSKNIPTRIVVSAGHYRSYFDINTTKLLIVEAETPGDVFLSGSDVFNTWQKEGEYFYHDWFYKWGFYEDSMACFGPCNLTKYQRRRELVFIDSDPVLQVLSKEELVENSFFVDESSSRIYLKPPLGVNPLNSLVEVATRGFDIYDLGRNGSLVRATVHNGQGLVLKGLVFQHTANTMHQDALTVFETENLIVEDCIFQWNNGVGFEMEKCSNVTINNIVVRHNGERGMGSWMGKNIHIKDVQIYGNNWRTNAPKMIAHDAAGIKIFGGNRNVILENLKVFNNYCHAIWFDWDNENYVIKNSLIKNNQESGIMLEGSRKSALVQNCIIRNNDIGIKGYGHANVTVENSIIVGNNHQFSLGQDGRIVSEDHNWEINSENWKIFNNHIIATEKEHVLFSFFEYSNPDPPSTWASNDFFRTIQADNNHYFHPSCKKQFPDGKYLTGGQLTFSKWKKRTGQDKNSIWQNSIPESSSINK